MNRIKVAYFIGSLGYGGTETQLLELLANLDRAHVEPSLILLDCEHVARAEHLVEGGCDLRVPRRGKKGRSIADVRRAAAAVIRLAAYLKRARPDIVHAMLPEAHLIAAAALGIVRGPKLIGGRRSLAGAYRRSSGLDVVDRLATRRADVMLCNSHAIAREIVEIDSVPRERVVHIYNGVDVKRFRPGNREARHRAGWTDSNVVFGMVANFRASKRHIDFIKAAGIIARATPEARFMLAGKDHEGIVARLKEEIRARGLKSRFAILPMQTNPETLYPSLDVFLCTSETEGLSNVLLEAAACCLPIVATNVGGNPEVVRDGFNGFLVEPNAPAEAAAAALRLDASPELRREMGRRGRQWISSEFSIEAMVNAHLALYKQLARPSYCARRHADISQGVSVQ
jgi:glycosyltransferase involved in cell wall biosynthesis